MTPLGALSIMICVMVGSQVAVRYIEGERAREFVSLYMPATAAAVLSLILHFWWGVALSLVALLIVVLTSLRT